MSFRPTPQQERWLRIASRKTLARDTPWLAERISGWTAATSVTRCAFFVLGVFASGLIAAVFDLLHVPKDLLFAGLLLVACAEWLIVRRGFFGAGIEEALELAGLLMIVLQGVNLVGGSDVRISLLVAIVLLATGGRLLNPLFIALGVVVLSFTIDLAGPRQSITPTRVTALAGAFCVTVACVALYIHRHQFRRPSFDAMVNWLIITTPLAGYLWFESQNPSGLSIESLRNVSLVRLLPLLILMIFGLTALIVGIRRRAHAPIIAFMICSGCVAYELRDLTTLTLKMKLICWGTVALLLTLGLDRYLRTPRRGITSNQFAERKGSLDLLQLAGASALAPQSVQHSDAQFTGGGGRAGGGGASRSY